MSSEPFTINNLEPEDAKLIGEPLLSWMEILQGQSKPPTPARQAMLHTVCGIVVGIKRGETSFDVGQMIAFVQKSIEAVNCLENSIALSHYKNRREQRT